MVGEGAAEAVGELALGGVVATIRSRQQRGSQGAELGGALVVKAPALGETLDPRSDRGNLEGPALCRRPQSFATQTGRSAIGTSPFGHGLLPGRTLTQVLLTCE